MIEVELILEQIQKVRKEERGIRNRVLLEQAYKALKEYERATRKE